MPFIAASNKGKNRTTRRRNKAFRRILWYIKKGKYKGIEEIRTKEYKDGKQQRR